MINISVSGRAIIVSGLNPPTLSGPAVETLVNAGSDRVLSVSRQRAPKKTGALQGNISSKMTGSRLTRRGKITNDVVRKGFRYGWALETSKKRQYYYRSSGSVGDSTRGWFSGAAKIASDQIAADMARADSDIQRALSAL